MNPRMQSQPVPDARLAGGLMNVVRELQKNRFSGIRELQGVPIGAEAMGADVLNALNKNRQQNEQEQNAAPAPGTFQEEGSQEQGRQRNVGQRKAPGSFGQST